MTFTEQMQAVVESYIENQASPALSTQTEETESSETLDTPFGAIDVDQARAITFEKGIPGLEEATEYALAPMPDPSLSSYLMLHSLQVPQLTLVTLPMDPKIDLIDDADLQNAVDSLNIKMDDALFLLLVSIRHEPEAAVSVNLRAPLIIDVNTRKGSQYIIPNTKYDLRHKIA